MRLRFAMIALLHATALSAQTVRDSILTISTVRYTRVPADRASLYFVIEGSAETAADAVARVQMKLKSVTDALNALGKNVQVEAPISYAVNTAPQNGVPAPATPINVSRTVVRVHVLQSGQVASVVAAGVGAGAVSASALTFESTATDSVRRARIAEALAVSRLDAQTIATSIGGRLGALVDVDLSGAGYLQVPQINLDTRNVYSGQAQAPEVMVTTAITVKYRLIP